jgi:hypothetical protein
MVARLGHITNPWTSSIENQGLSFLNTSNSPLSIFDWGSSYDREAPDPFALPPENQMDLLVEQYFSDVGLLFPNIHKPSFLDNVAHMKRHGPHTMRKTWLGLLNMMLAFGTLTIVRDDWGADSRAGEARMFYERAVRLCDHAALKGTSLEVGMLST